jgi:hypothetical protein
MRTYFIQDQATGLVKIGIAKDPDKRLRDLQVGCPGKLLMIGMLPDNRERELHKRFAALRVRGEWFKPKGAVRSFIENCVPLRDTQLIAHQPTTKQSQDLMLDGICVHYKVKLLATYEEAHESVGTVDDITAWEWTRLDAFLQAFVEDRCDPDAEDYDEDAHYAGDCSCEGSLLDQAYDLIREVHPFAVWGAEDHVMFGLHADTVLKNLATYAAKMSALWHQLDYLGPYAYFLLFRGHDLCECLDSHDIYAIKHNRELILPGNLPDHITGIFKRVDNPAQRCANNSIAAQLGFPSQAKVEETP